MTTISPARDQRVAIRLTTQQKNLIEKATSITGGSVTDFAIHAMIDKAQDLLSDQPMFLVDQAAWDEFNRLLDAPPKPVPGMVDLLTTATVAD
jgi:uncharacterized protein (DUF1778 family)